MGLIHAIHQLSGNDIVGILVIPAVRIQICKGLAGTMGRDDLTLFHDFAADGTDFVTSVTGFGAGSFLGVLQLDGVAQSGQFLHRDGLATVIAHNCLAAGFRAGGGNHSGCGVLMGAGRGLYTVNQDNRNLRGQTQVVIGDHSKVVLSRLKGQWIREFPSRGFLSVGMSEVICAKDVGIIDIHLSII